LAIIVFGIAAVALVVDLLSGQNPAIRYSSWVVGGLLVVGFVGYRWRRFVIWPSIHENLSDLEAQRATDHAITGWEGLRLALTLTSVGRVSHVVYSVPAFRVVLSDCY
jgi:hypothetical protein